MIILFAILFVLFPWLIVINEGKKQAEFDRAIISECINQKEPTELCKVVIKKYTNEEKKEDK
jgi:hypothetical protein